MKRTTKLFGSFSIFAALAACNAPLQVETDRKIDEATNFADVSFNRLGDRDAMVAGSAQNFDRVYTAPIAVPYTATDSLPAKMRATNAITLTSADKMSLEEVVDELTRLSGIPHFVALGPTGQIVAGQAVRNAADAGASASDISAAENAAITKAKALAAQAGVSSSVSKIRMQPNLRGSLPAVLDKVATHFQLAWEIEEGRVLLRDYVTRQFQISAMATDVSSSTSIGSNGQSTNINTSSNVWDEIEEGIKGLVDANARVTIGRSTGIITVTAGVGDQKRISDFVERMNSTLGQQVAFNVNVLTVSNEKQTSRGADIAAKIGQLSDGEFQMGSEIFTASGGLGAYSMGTISGDFSIGALVTALRSEGRTVTMRRAGGSTSNNRLMPIQSVNETPYVSSVSTTTDSDGDEEVTRTVAVATTGFQMQVTPRVLNPKEVSVQFNLELSEVNSIKSFGEGSDMIQSPDVARTEFSQQKIVESGETLVLLGFDRERKRTSKDRSVNVLSSASSASDASTERVTTIILITPSILKRR